jgi:hypothetical protein
MTDDSFFQSNYAEGIRSFHSARARAFWNDAISLFRGQPAELMSFEDIRARLRLREESYKGLQNVPLERIVGSMGRYRDFTSEFLPKNNKMRERWSRVYAQANSMEGWPPIDLYKVDDVYFVRDGNHRVSVARQLGMKTIEAHVTELPTSIDLEPGMTLKQLDAAEAYAEFLQQTQLDRTRPHHQSIQLSDPARYIDIMEHIHMHMYALELEGDCPCSLQDAAQDWYDNVYRPALTMIRKFKILDHFPKRTEADLYVWLVSHLSDVKREFGDAAKQHTFSHALADLLTEERKPIPQELLIEQDETVSLVRKEVLDAVEAYKTSLPKTDADPKKKG